MPKNFTLKPYIIILLISSILLAPTTLVIMNNSEFNPLLCLICWIPYTLPILAAIFAISQFKQLASVKQHLFIGGLAGAVTGLSFVLVTIIEGLILRSQGIIGQIDNPVNYSLLNLITYILVLLIYIIVYTLLGLVPSLIIGLVRQKKN